MSWKTLGAAALMETFTDAGTEIHLSELAGHLSARDQIRSNYGGPGVAYMSKFCEVWPIKKEFPWFPADKIFINKDFRKKLTPALQQLVKRGLYAEIKTFDGCYNDRLSRGLKVTSLHAWAMAMDLNASTNPLGGHITWSLAFLETMRESEIYCGADWKRKDGMHFALYNG